MINGVVLWLAQELLKFLAARLFKNQLQLIFDRWDERTREMVWPSSDDISTSMEVAVFASAGELATPLQRAVLRLLYDPLKAAAKQ